MLDHDTLALIWFFLLGVLLIGYTILDGFDLGVGILHPAARTDEHRRVMMNSIFRFCWLPSLNTMGMICLRNGSSP